MLEALRQRFYVETVVPSDPILETFKHHLLANREEHILAIIFYGSRLSQETLSASSVHDFYIITDNLVGFHHSCKHALINLILPPNVYHGAFPFKNNEKSSLLQCKYCVISRDQFLHETSARSSDFHHLGRFSKRFGVLYSRDQDATDLLFQGSLNAMLTLLPFSCSLLPSRFSLEDLVLKQLEISYLGEERLVEPDKIFRLFEAAKDFYLNFYPNLITLYRESHPELIIDEDDQGFVRGPITSSLHQKTDRLLKRSRRRSILRWPKYIFTVDNWVEYLLDKVERHQGIRIELTPLQKRYPLIFAWPIFFKFKKRGLVK